jgi:hypothetical protein
VPFAAVAGCGLVVVTFSFFGIQQHIFGLVYVLHLLGGIGTAIGIGVPLLALGYIGRSYLSIGSRSAYIQYSIIVFGIVHGQVTANCGSKNKHNTMAGSILPL